MKDFYPTNLMSRNFNVVLITPVNKTLKGKIQKGVKALAF
jgi:hypothetical protein